VHEPLEHRRRLKAHSVAGGVDRAEGGVRQRLDQVVIVDTEDGNVVRHTQSQRPATVQHRQGRAVVAAHDRRRATGLRKPGQDFEQLLLA